MQLSPYIAKSSLHSKSYARKTLRAKYCPGYTHTYILYMLYTGLMPKLSNLYRLLALVGVASGSLQADSQPGSFGLVRGLATAWRRAIFITWSGWTLAVALSYDDSTINTIVIIIIIISEPDLCIITRLRLARPARSPTLYQLIDFRKHCFSKSRAIYGPDPKSMERTNVISNRPDDRLFKLKFACRIDPFPYWLSRPLFQKLWTLNVALDRFGPARPAGHPTDAQVCSVWSVTLDQRCADITFRYRYPIRIRLPIFH